MLMPCGLQLPAGRGLSGIEFEGDNRRMSPMIGNGSLRNPKRVLPQAYEKRTAGLGELNR